MIDEEIKVAVAKDLEMEAEQKLKTKQAQHEAVYKNFKMKASSPGKQPKIGENLNETSKSEAKSEILLDKETLSKIEKLYRGTDKEKLDLGSNQKIIGEILDVGRLDFLKSSKMQSRGAFTSQFPGARAKRGMYTCGSQGWISPKTIHRTPFTQNKFSATQYVTCNKPEIKQSPAVINKIASNRISDAQNTMIKTSAAGFGMELPKINKKLESDKMRKSIFR